MLRKLQVLAAAARLQTFTVAELARAAKVPEATVHTVLQRSPADWFTKAKTVTGARGGQPHQHELTAAGAAGIEERLSRLPTSEPLAAADLTPSESTTTPTGLSSARALLKNVTASASPAAAEALREDAVHSLEWAEAELDDGGFADNAAALREEIGALRRQLDDVPGTRGAARSSSSYVSWLTQFADGLRSLAARFDVHRRVYKVSSRTSAFDADSIPIAAELAESRFPKVFFSYFGSDPRAREMASFAAGVLASQVQNLGHDWIQPSEAHDLLRIGEPGTLTAEFDQPLQLLLCISTPSASHELRTILKQARVLIDKRCFTPESWVLDCGHNREVERVTRKLALNYEPNARQPSNWSRWVDLIFVSAARAPLVPGALPFKGAPKLANEASAATRNEPAVLMQVLPTIRLTTRRLSSTAFQGWIGKHAKGAKFTATIRQVDTQGAIIDLGDGVQGHLKASELATESFKADQKMPALYTNSSQKRRTITVLLDTPKKEDRKPRLYAIKRVDPPAATARKTRSKSQA